MTYEHFIYTKDLASAQALAGIYQAAGFIAEPHERDDEPLGLVLVYTAYDDAITDQMIAIADAHGATYDGGCAYLGDLEGLT